MVRTPENEQEMCGWRKIFHRVQAAGTLISLTSLSFERIQEKILEVSMAFSGGGASLEEYVFTLKSVVGIRALVPAVGIGKGERDLSTLSFDISRNHQISAARPEMHSGKAWLAITRAEIVRYITGNVRPSKSRSLDLFWNAVWPRLLARGWHSEIPEASPYKGSDNLVFIVPGIKKFSRSELYKGDHCFDSVDDVLRKVAKHPELLDLGSEKNETNPGCSKGESSGSSTQVRSDAHYLKPRVSLGHSDLPKFTVVDTSLADEDGPNVARKVRRLPEELGSRSMKHQLRHCVRDGVSSCVGPIRNSPRLTSNVDRDVPYVLGLPAKKRTAVRVVGPKPGRIGARLKPENVSAADRRVVNESVQGSSSGTHAGFDISRAKGEPSAPKLLIDLNLPPAFEPEIGVEVVILGEEEPGFEQTPNSVIPTCSDIGKRDIFVAKEQKKSEDVVCWSDHSVTQMSTSLGEPSKKAAKSDQRPSRQSTRNRPATVKLLEAFQSGFLSPVRTYRKRSTLPALEQIPKRAPSKSPNGSAGAKGPSPI